MRICIIMLTALLIGVPASSTVRAEDPEKPNRKDLKAQFMEKFDENKDGKIDAAERAKAKAAKATKPVGKGNAKLDELLKKFDANGDGKLDDEERNNARLELAKNRKAEGAAAAVGGAGVGGQLGGGGANGADREAMMRQFDANGDGILDAIEKAKLRDALAANRVGGDRDGMMKQFDANGDGQLDAMEKGRMRDAMQGGRTGGQLGPGGKGFPAGPRPGGAGKAGPRPGGKN